MIRLAVTGTDTGVGKTVVSCAIVAAFARQAMRVAAMKPIETGVSFNDPSRDGARLSAAGGKAYPLSATAPVVLRDPVAPLVAARRSRTVVDLTALDRAVDVASDGAEVVLVEGAGGLLVPVASGVSFATLFHRWSLDIVVVAANRLGVINHTRLTCAAARSAGLPIRAIVLNHASPPRADDTSVVENAGVIAELEEVPVFEFPWLDVPYDFDRSASVAERIGLVGRVASLTGPRVTPV